jgi:hypothetical protein
MSRVAAFMFLCASTALGAGCGEVDLAPDAAIDASSDPVMRFCSDYGTTCGFGNTFGGDTYSDLNNCVDRFGSYNAARRSCTEEALSFAQAADPAINCLAAEGDDPCDARRTFCDQYGITCGFGNTRGGQAYIDAPNCLQRYDTYLASRQECVQLHLGFAETNADLHCPHVEGAAPCN